MGAKSIVEGKVTGMVINSFISEDSELDYSVVVDSVIKNTKYKAQYSGLVSTLANINLSKIINAYSGDTRSPIPVISVHSVGNFQYRFQN